MKIFSILAKNYWKIAIELFAQGAILHENQSLSQIYFVNHFRWTGTYTGDISANGEGYPRVVIWETLRYEVGAKLQYKEPFFHQHEEYKRSACS